jgi:hypothetical protein
MSHIVSVIRRVLNCTERRECQPRLQRSHCIEPVEETQNSNSVSVSLAHFEVHYNTAHTTSQYSVQVPHNKFRIIQETGGWVPFSQIASARP